MTGFREGRILDLVSLGKSVQELISDQAPNDDRGQGQE